MRQFLLLICLFLPLTVLSQAKDTIKRDSSNRSVIIKDMYITPKKALIVVNGIIYTGDVKEIKPEDIIKVSVLQPPGAITMFGKAGANGVILIETSSFEPGYYQKKLSLFSKEYKNYLYQNNGNDSGLVYVLNGVVIVGSQSEVLKKLYEEIRKVKTVNFIEKFSKTLNTNNPKPIVIITTTP